MSLRVGESGKTLRIAAGFDLSSNTELSLAFTTPAGATVTKTKTGGVVTLGTAPVTDADLGALSANQYVEYEIEPGFLSAAGQWFVQITYTNTGATPDDVFIGERTAFTVLA